MRIQIAKSPEEIAACLRLRHRVFVEEQGVSETDEVDGLDDSSTHILVIDGERLGDGIPVAAARLRFVPAEGREDGVAAIIQRVCVAPTHRGRGLGREIMEFMLTHVRTDGRTKIARLSAQTDAMGLYEKLGFTVTSDVYMDAGIPHKDMEKQL